MAEVYLVKLLSDWMPLDLTDDKSTLVQVMAWCRQATSHYLSQFWPRFMSPYGVTRPQWVNNLTQYIFLFVLGHDLCPFCITGGNIDGLVQDCSNSSALAIELRQFCTKPSIYDVDIFSVSSICTSVFVCRAIGSLVRTTAIFTGLYLCEFNRVWFHPAWLSIVAGYVWIWHVTLMDNVAINISVPNLQVGSLQLIWRSGASSFHLWVPGCTETWFRNETIY